MMLHYFVTVTILSLSLQAKEEVQQPKLFELHDVKGEAHPLLSKAEHWVHDDGIGFDSLHRTEFRRFDSGKVTLWSRKTPAARGKGPIPEGLEEIISEEERKPYQSWKHFMQIGDWLESYAIDEKGGRMFNNVFVEVGKNSWFHGQIQLGAYRVENLYDFDRCPFENKTGKFTHIQLHQDFGSKEPQVKTVTRGEFITSFNTNEEYDYWQIIIKGGPHSQSLYRTKWHQGADIFSPTDFHRRGGWKAIIKPQVREPQPNPEHRK